jgi:pyruvate,orthophosphate dikinase
MGKCCVSGASEIKVDEEKKLLTIGDEVFEEGDFLSLDGTTGNVYDGEIDTVAPELKGDFGTIMKWADDIRTLAIRTNADNPRDAQQAVEFGAEGIGLCRTEHMFFAEERISAIRRKVKSAAGWCSQTSRAPSLSFTTAATRAGDIRSRRKSRCGI